MNRRPRIYYTDSQKALMWERWQEGATLHQIARLFDRAHTSVRRILAETGGIRPPERRRSRLVLTLAEREEISRAVVAGQSIRTTATLLGRAPSTVSREIKRNGGQGGYRATQADRAAWDRARRPKTCKLAENRALAHIVTDKLQSQWSPEQIAGWLKHTYPCDEPYHVSHETIYRSLFIQARGALKKELVQHLRHTRGMRRSRHHTQKTEDHGKIIGAVSISERPATVEDRAVPGHWEGDLLFGSQNSQIATLVERQTRYVMLVKVAGKDTDTVVNALIKNARKLPQQLYKSLTWDRGKEMAGHKRFTLATDMVTTGGTTMKSIPWVLAFAVAAGLSVSQQALGQEKPYTEGTVWGLTFIKLKPGMFDVYMQDAVVGRAREMAEAKKQGLVLSYKVLSGTSANREDWDILFIEEYKNWAALDGLSEKFAAIQTKAHGTVEKVVEASLKRTDVREVVGTKLMQELIIK